MTPLELIRMEAGPEIALETRFENMEIDSLEFVDLILRLEQQFNVKIEDEMIAKILTVGELCGLIDRLRADNQKGIEYYVSS